MSQWSSVQCAVQGCTQSHVLNRRHGRRFRSTCRYPYRCRSCIGRLASASTVIGRASSSVRTPPHAASQSDNAYREACEGARSIHRQSTSLHRDSGHRPYASSPAHPTAAPCRRLCKGFTKAFNVQKAFGSTYRCLGCGPVLLCYCGTRTWGRTGEVEKYGGDHAWRPLRI